MLMLCAKLKDNCVAKMNVMEEGDFAKLEFIGWELKKKTPSFYLCNEPDL